MIDKELLFNINNDKSNPFIIPDKGKKDNSEEESIQSDFISRIFSINLEDDIYSKTYRATKSSFSDFIFKIDFPKNPKILYRKILFDDPPINFYELKIKDSLIDEDDEVYKYLKTLDIDRLNDSSSNSYSTQELREICKKINQPISGKKKILIEKVKMRLMEYKLI